MTYLITALDAEARPLIEHYRLKRDFTLPYTVYHNDEIVLLVTQPGRINAMMALSALLGWKLPQPNDILINIGICGGPKSFSIGEALLIHKIQDTTRRYYPDILYPHSFRESPLACIDTPADTPSDVPVDMESVGIFAAASRFFKLHRIAFLKIVSDHCDPQSVTKEKVISLIQEHVQTLEALVDSMQNTLKEEPLFSNAEQKQIDTWKDHFTAAQRIKLDDALCYYRLKSPKRPIPFPASEIPSSKRERSALLDEFIAALIA